MGINPHQAAEARHGLATRTIKKLEISIDELLRLEWRGPGRTIFLHEEKILANAKVMQITVAMRDILIDGYQKLGWSIEIKHRFGDATWKFCCPTNLEISDELIY